MQVFKSLNSLSNYWRWVLEGEVGCRNLQSMISSWVSCDWLELELQRYFRSYDHQSPQPEWRFRWWQSERVTGGGFVKTTQGMCQSVICDSTGRTSAPRPWFMSEKVDLGKCKEKGLVSCKQETWGLGRCYAEKGFWLGFTWHYAGVSSVTWSWGSQILLVGSCPTKFEK